MIRLRQREGTEDLAFRHLGQVLILLLLRTTHINRTARLHSHNRGDGAVGTRNIHQRQA